MNIAKKILFSQNQVNINTHIVQLSKLSPWKGFAYLVFDWAAILASIALANHFNTWSVYSLALLVIASRQHAFLMIVHEAVHYRLSSNKKLNDFISQNFAALPFFFCTFGYRTNHLKHHRHLNSAEDPDWARKTPLKEWQFPQTKIELVGTFFTVLFTSWYKLLLLFYSFSGVGSKATYQDKSLRKALLYKVAYYSVALAAFYHFDLLHGLVLYWIVPYLVVFPLIERVRSISEHFALSYSNDYNQTRNVMCGPIEAFIFGPHNIRYHLVHHLYPGIPQYNLPRFYEHLMKDEEFARESHENDGYLIGKKSVLKDIISEKHNAKEIK